MAATMVRWWWNRDGDSSSGRMTIPVF